MGLISFYNMKILIGSWAKSRSREMHEEELIQVLCRVGHCVPREGGLLVRLHAEKRFSPFIRI